MSHDHDKHEHDKHEHDKHEHEEEIEKFRFFVLPNNTSGSIATPISLSPTPTTLATLALRSDCDNISAVLLTATVGWLAVTNGTGLGKVDVLFKIWRGTPAMGTVIFSTDTSGESGFDNRFTTSFTHVDSRFGFFPVKIPIYTLTAELPDPGSAATVIGPVTFAALEFERAD